MDDDFNKPMLSCQPCSDNLPIVLSSDGVVPRVQVPASIAQYLRNYQRDGVRFLYCKFTSSEGGILADDMGLGKTIQAIAFIAAILEMKGTKEDKLRHCSKYIREDIAPGIEVPSVNPVLIVCPASLSHNWYDELQTWGYFKVFILSNTNKYELLGKAKRKECDVVIVTFETARTCIYNLNSVVWSCVIADEVHRIKDPNSQLTKAMCSLKCKFRYGLTGTPFQNNMTELWCLLNWCNPDCVGDLNTFKNNIAREIEHGQRRNATKGNVVKRKLAQIKLNSLRRRYVFRRTKDILSKHLPSKTDKIVFCKLTPIQENIYRMIVQSPNVQKLLRQVKESKCSKEAKYLKKRSTGLLFTFLHLLQKTANHAGLLASSLTPDASDIAQEFSTHALEECAGLRDVPKNRWLEALSDVNMSGKMQVLSKLLPMFLQKGDKILLFSYSTKVLDLVQKYVVKMRYKYFRLDGSTPADTRFGLVGKFNTSPDPAIFLLSTKAGGVGLNMTGANVVIIFDPNWNPAYDLQAQDRAYRLGQERDVRVYRLLSTSTIEEYVYLRQVYKQQLASLAANRSVSRLFDSVSGDSRYYGELFGIHNLFSFRENERSLTQEILEKQKNLELNLRLKLELPLRDWRTGVHLSKCAIADNRKRENEDVTSDTTTKSGLAQLCEVVFDTTCEDQESGELVESQVEKEIDEDVDESESLREFDEYEDEDEEVDEIGDSQLVEEYQSLDVKEELKDEEYESFDVKEEVQDEEHNPLEMKEEILEDVFLEDVEDGNAGHKNRNESINSLLEKSGAVRDVIDHSKVVAPSTMEDFVSDCAMRDVFQRGVSSHLPAFNCSAVTQNEEMNQVSWRTGSSSPNLCRLKFNLIAKDEYLTPFELATKVMSMSYREKANLLKKHRKRKSEATEGRDLPSVKQSKSSATNQPSNINMPALEFVDCGTASDIHVEGTNNDAGINSCETDVLHNGEEAKDDSDNVPNTKTVLVETEDGIIAVDVESTQKSTSDNSEPSSSFENDVSMFNPNLSRKGVALMEGLFCTKNKKIKKSLKASKAPHSFIKEHSYALSGNYQLNKIQNSTTAGSKPSPFDSDCFEKDCSVSAVSLIDSLFFSSKIRKPCPRKGSSGVSGIGGESSTPALEKVSDQSGSDTFFGNSPACKSSVDEEAISFSPDPRIKNFLNSTFFRNLPNEDTLEDTPVSSHAAPHYKSEDDVYRRLIKSGKLKQK